MTETGTFLGTLMQVWRGLPLTLLLTFAPLLLAFAPAVWLGYRRQRRRGLSFYLTGAYVTLMRSLPIVLQILFAYSWLPSLLDGLAAKWQWPIDIFSVSPVWYALAVLFLNTLASLLEVFRGAFAAVPAHEREAARAAGLTEGRVFLHVLLPQAIIHALPNLATATVNLVRMSSLAYLMTIPEMTGRARMAAGLNFDTVTSYAALLLSYVLLCFLIDFVYDRIYARVIDRFGGRAVRRQA